MTGAAQVAGRPVPDRLLGPLRASPPDGDTAALNRRLAEDGYLFLPGMLDPDRVLAARRAVFERLAEVGEIRRPAEDGIASGTSRRAELTEDPGGFLKTICDSPALRRISHGPELHALATGLFGAPARAFDFLWLRPTPVGRASPLHFDHVYMNRGSDRVVTVWIPLGPAPICDGPLLVVEGSHRFDDLIADYRGLDVDRDRGRSGSFADDPVAIAERYGARLLTADFSAGDVVLFGPFTLHGSLDNHSPLGRVRLSCDARYQPAADPVDERWFGAEPPGHGGLGYAGMNAARPLTEAGIRR